MTLEDLVPPLELCKQIPAGKFQDSALVWMNTLEWVEGKYKWIQIVEPRRYAELIEAPAPTLAEILDKTAKYTENPATAALKLWLEEKTGREKKKIMEDKEKFTPGPWEIDPELHDAVRANACLICSAWTLPDCAHGTREANVALIAAAPEMYYLLERLPSDIRHLLQSGNTDMCKRIVGKIDAILKKARGEE